MMNKQTLLTNSMTVLPAERWEKSPKATCEVRTLYHSTGRSITAETSHGFLPEPTARGSFVRRLVDQSSLLLSAVGFGGAVCYMLAGVIV